MSLLWWYSYPTIAWNKLPQLSSAHSSSSCYSDILIVEKLSTHGLPRWLMTLWPLPLTYHSGLFKLCCLPDQIGSSRQESKWLFNSAFEDFLLPDTRQSSSDDCLIQSQRSSLSGQLLLSFYQMRTLKCRECWEGVCHSWSPGRWLQSHSQSSHHPANNRRYQYLKAIRLLAPWR